MIVAAGLVLLAAQGPTEGSKPLLVDLAALAPGAVHRIFVTGERPFTADLVNRVPGATYQVTNTDREGSGGMVGLNRYGPDDVGLRSWSDTAGCGDVVKVVRDVLAATEETQVGALLAVGGPVEATLARSPCPRSDPIRSSLSAITRAHALQSGGVAMGEWLDLKVERAGSPSAPAKTWSIRFEATGEPSFGWAHPNEASWLASEIASDLAEMAAFARGQAVPTPRVEIRTDAATGRVLFDRGAPRELTIALDDSVWSPGAWEAIARRLLEGEPRRAAALAPEVPVPEALTDPRALVLEKENQRLSAWLARDMRSAEAHEQAALLLAAVALRESAGIFSDHRLGLCRLTSHLALARVLRAGSTPGRSGVFAEVARLVLLGRQQDAIAALAQGGAGTSAEQAWANALRIRVTADWRILKAPVTATLLERREHYRALDRSLGDKHAIAFLDLRNTEAIPDWGRIALASSASVGGGNRFGPRLLGLELAEVAALHRESRGGDELAAPDLVAPLNEPPGRCIRRPPDGRARPQVVDWGGWASSGRRHVLHALASADQHRRSMLGLPDEADQAWAKARESLKGLELLSLVAVQVSSHRSASPGTGARGRSSGAPGEDGCGEATPVVESHPERVGAASWSLLRRTCDRTGDALRLAGQKRWFGSSLPEGTAFDAAARRRLLGGFGLPGLEGILRVAPWDRDVADGYYLRRATNRGTVEDVEAAYGRLLDYDLKAMKVRAALLSDDPDRYRAAYTRIVALDPDSGLDLGTYLAGRGLEEEAAAAFQKAVDEALDRVGVANRAGWLVDYYLDRAERDRAFAVARDMGEVGSTGGLLALAHFFERTGHCAEAESRLRAKDERYPDSSPEDLRCFYLRCVDDSGDPRFRPEARASRARTLGSRGDPVTLASLSGRPLQGVVVVESAPMFESKGLVKGAVLVAIDGQRVRDFEHYRCLRTLGEGPEATAIVWHAGSYVEIRAPLRRPHPALTLRSLSGSR